MQGLRTAADGEMQEFGWLITAAFGLDTSWHQRAACREYPVSQRVDGKSPWHVQNDFEHDGVTGRELIKVALMICHSCDAQYDCARYAIEGWMRGGTYAMDIGDLTWLQKESNKHGVDNMALVDSAQLDGVPVQIQVGRARAAVRARAASAA